MPVRSPVKISWFTQKRPRNHPADSEANGDFAGNFTDLAKARHRDDVFMGRDLQDGIG